MKKITKDTVLAEIIKKKGAEDVLAKNKMPCVTCPFAKFEMEKLNLGEVCKAYGLDLKKILAGINALDKNGRA
jgi:hypothetical protein